MKKKPTALALKKEQTWTRLWLTKRCELFPNSVNNRSKFRYEVALTSFWKNYTQI